MAGSNELSGPDLTTDGVAVGELADGAMVLGHAEGKPVLVMRVGGQARAVGARCTHYGGPLAEGVFDGASLRCPWHHARFDIITGRAVRPPALDPIPAYRTEERDGRVFVIERLAPPAPSQAPLVGPDSVVVVGAGAAGAAAVETLRGEGYQGPLTLIGNEGTVPVDRPNLSKDYLAGTAPEEWVPLRSEGFYADRQIRLLADRTVAGLHRGSSELALDDGTRIGYGALLLATGAEPIRLDVPGADHPHVHYLRTLADSRAIIDAAGGTSQAVVIGAGFIGMEVAASLRRRGLEVAVVASDTLPLRRVLGNELASFVKVIHEEHGVRFHLGRRVSAIGEREVTLDDGTLVPAELVVAGVGVRPRTGLAEQAGLEVDDGIVVDRFLQTSDPAIWAAGDVARWPDPRFGSIRIEHWVVAERQGQAAVRNMLGRREPFADVPFFWSQHYDVPINVVGNTSGWEETRVRGNPAERDVLVAYRKGGQTVAVASIYRDMESLRAEIAFERGDDDALARLIDR